MGLPGDGVVPETVARPTNAQKSAILRGEAASRFTYPDACGRALNCADQARQSSITAHLPPRMYFSTLRLCSATVLANTCEWSSLATK